MNRTIHNRIKARRCAATAIAAVLILAQKSWSDPPGNDRPGIVAKVDPNDPGFGPRTPPNLLYNGGPVISNVRIVMVLYGTGVYLGNIAGSTTPTMATWYTQVTNSQHMDWLREYDTDVAGGTNQNIGRGTFVGQFMITPAAARNGSLITDQNVRDELAAQLNALNLPAADANTIYMIHFRHGQAITTGGSTSCVQFCAYHWNFLHGGIQIHYAVLPDFASGSGCEFGCGPGTQFHNQNYAAAHEMIETVTDPVPRSGWDDPDPNNDEIGDICNQQEDTVVGLDGVSYTVQKEWSNLNNACSTAPPAHFWVNGGTGNDANFATPGRPKRTVRSTVNLIPPNGNIIMHVAPGGYTELPVPLTISKAMQIVNSNPGAGTVRVGGP